MCGHHSCSFRYLKRRTYRPALPCLSTKLVQTGPKPVDVFLDRLFKPQLWWTRSCQLKGQLHGSSAATSLKALGSRFAAGLKLQPPAVSKSIARLCLDVPKRDSAKQLGIFPVDSLGTSTGDQTRHHIPQYQGMDYLEVELLKH